jgi:predicted DNA binding protein
MKYVDLRIHHEPETLHPMHAFEMHHEGIERASLLHWNTVLDGTNTMVFRVRGDPEPFRAKLASRDATVAYSLSEAVDGVFYCCVRDHATDADRDYIEAFARGTLVVVPPVAFNPDGTTELTLVGTPADVDAAVEGLPNGLRATVRSVGPYRRRAGPTSPPLTDRQREAVAAAVDCGYYDSPRRGAVADVATELGVSPGTAAEHLRKAEAAVMDRLVE